MRTEQPELIGGPEKRPIEIMDYDPAWPAMFRVHAQNVREALRDAALRIEHIGSTAVPSLAAKPIIDMLLIVEDAGDEPSYVPALEAAGYVLRVREPAFHQHRMLRTPQRDVHLHVLSCGCREIERYLLFRDQLRASPGDRLLYEQTKRRLARQDWPEMNAYAEAKSEVVERIIAAAQAGRDTLTHPTETEHRRHDANKAATCRRCPEHP